MKQSPREIAIRDMKSIGLNISVLNNRTLITIDIEFNEVIITKIDDGRVFNGDKSRFTNNKKSRK